MRSQCYFVVSQKCPVCMWKYRANNRETESVLNRYIVSSSLKNNINTSLIKTHVIISSNFKWTALIILDVKLESVVLVMHVILDVDADLKN